MPNVEMQELVKSMKLEEFMQELGARLGLGEISLDEDGGAQLVINDEIAIDIGSDETGNQITLSATVGRLSDENQVAVFQELLAANLGGSGTGGAALAIDIALSEIVLCRGIPCENVPFDVLERELNVFIEALRFWTDRHQNDLVGVGKPDNLGAPTDASGLQGGPAIRV